MPESDAGSVKVRAVDEKVPGKRCWECEVRAVDEKDTQQTAL